MVPRDAVCESSQKSLKKNKKGLTLGIDNLLPTF